MTDSRRDKIPDWSTKSVHNWAIKNRVSIAGWQAAKAGVWIPMHEAISDLWYKIESQTYYDLIEWSW